MALCRHLKAGTRTVPDRRALDPDNKALIGAMTSAAILEAQALPH